MSERAVRARSDLQPLDIQAVRADFPAMSLEVHGKPLVFLDSGASAQKPRVVIETMRRVYESEYANVHRGAYYLSERATALYEGARDKLRDFLNARSRKEIIFTRNATEAINLVAYAWGRKFLKAGDEIIISEMEHHSNIVPWQMLRDEKGLTLKVAPVTDDGEFRLDAFKALLTDRTKLVAITHTSNVLGTITPAKEIVRLAHDAGAKVLLDGAQAAVHMPVDVQDLDCDFYAITGHKLYGPSGIGVLYGKEALLDAMPPFMGGGDMIGSVSFEKTTWAALPAKFEAGTPAIVQAIGFGAAVDYVMGLGRERIAAHEQDLLDLRDAAPRLGRRVEDLRHRAEQGRGHLLHPRHYPRARHQHDHRSRGRRRPRRPSLRRAADGAPRRRRHRARLLRRLQHARGRGCAGPGARNRSGDIRLMLDELRELYQEVILDHGKKPRNFRRPEHPTNEAAGRNPLCGDQLVVYLDIAKDGRITDAAFFGKGCAISMASASMMTEIVKGKTVDEAKALFERFHHMCTDDHAEPVEDDEEMEKLQVLSGVRQFPVRVKCATLPWHTLTAAIEGVKEVSTEADG